MFRTFLMVFAVCAALFGVGPAWAQSDGKIPIPAYAPTDLEFAPITSFCDPRSEEIWNVLQGYLGDVTENAATLGRGLAVQEDWQPTSSGWFGCTRHESEESAQLKKDIDFGVSGVQRSVEESQQDVLEKVLWLIYFEKNCPKKK